MVYQCENAKLPLLLFSFLRLFRVEPPSSGRTFFVETRECSADFSTSLISPSLSLCFVVNDDDV